MNIYSNIDQMLAAEALLLDQGRTFSIDNLSSSPVMLMMYEFGEQLLEFGYWFEKFYIVLSGFAAVIFVVSKSMLNKFPKSS